MEKKKNDKKEGTMPVDIPAGAKFILVFEKNGKLGIQSGGFINIDEMLGFNRRAVNTEFIERVLIAGSQKQAQEKAQKDAGAASEAKPPSQSVLKT